MIVLGINGSAGAYRNTAYLVGKVLEGAANAGARTALFHLGRMAIAPCTGCAGCKSGNGCVVKDDMYEFYRRVENNMGLVIGTPVYFDHVSAQLKGFMDRMFAFLYPGIENHFPPGGRAVIVLTFGAGNPEGYGEVVDWISERLSGYFGIRTVGSLRLSGCPDNSLIADKNAEITKQAVELGQKLAAELSRSADS